MRMFKEMRQNFLESNPIGHTGNKNLKMISTDIFTLNWNILPSFLTSVSIKLMNETNDKDP
jgi:hypothetical protein